MPFESQEPYEPTQEPSEAPEEQPYEPTTPVDEDQRESQQEGDGLTYRNVDEEADHDESGEQG